MKKRALTKKRAQECIAKMKEFGTYRDQMIGRVREDFEGLGPTYRKGDYVIVTRQRPGAYVVEIPLALRDIDPRKRGYITTIGTMINVPAHLIKEVRMWGVADRLGEVPGRAYAAVYSLLTRHRDREGSEKAAWQ